MRTAVLLTGPPGVGKTTVVVRTVELLRDKGVRVAGFWTEEVRRGRGRIGFDIVRTDGSRTPLSRKDAESDVRVGPYAVLVDAASEAFDESRRILTTLEEGVFALDEFGPMEFKVPAFRALAGDVLEADTALLATYKQRGTHEMVDWLRRLPGALDWTVTPEIRDDLPRQAADALVEDATGKR